MMKTQIVILTCAQFVGSTIVDFHFSFSPLSFLTIFARRHEQEIETIKASIDDVIGGVDVFFLLSSVRFT